MELFKLFGSIILQGGDDAAKTIDQVDKKADSLGSKLGGMITTAGKWGAALAGGASAALGGMLALVNKTVAAADEIDKMSIRTGISRTQLQELQFAASQSGVKFESLQGAITRMTSALAGAEEGSDKMQEAFAQLGVTTSDNEGRMRRTDEVFNEALMSLARMENATERNALAMQIFGKGAIELVPLLDAGEEGIAQLTQRAHELNLVLSDEAIAANVAYADAMDQAKRAVGSMFMQIGTSLIPILMTFINLVLDNMPAIQQVFGFVFGAIGVVVNGFIQLIQQVIEWITQWYEDNQDVVDGIYDAFMEFFTLIIEAGKAFVGIFAALWDIFGERITEQIKIAFALITDVVGAAFRLMQGLLDIFIGVFTGDWRRAWEGVKKVVISIWDGIYAGIKATVNLIISAMNGMIGGLNKISFSVPNWVPVIGGNSWGFNLGKIPMLAEGGDILRSGAAIVGEAGPELLELPAGARVTPLSGGAGGGVTFARGAFEGAIILDDYGVDRLMDRIMDRLQVLGVRV